MYNNSSQYNSNEFAIIGSFTRSFDTSHKENNRIHLISSICLIKQKEISLMGKYLLDNSSNYSEKIFYVFILTPDIIENKDPEIIDRGSLVIIICSISTFLKNLFFTEESNSLFNNIFGRLDSEFKDFDVISQNSIFIFFNQMWSNVLLNFKINKVDISGGSISKRHILHTVDYQLVLHLLKMFDESQIMSNTIYNSFKDPILSSSIPLDYYKNFLERKTEILDMKVKDVKNISIIKKDPLTYGERGFSRYNSVEAIVKSNFIESIEMLITDITNGIKNELDLLQNTNKNYSDDLMSLSFKKSQIENIDNVSTRFMRNKEKKRFKKERAEIKSQGIPSQLSHLEYEISKLNSKKVVIEEQIFRKESELNQFIANSKEYTISELINLQKKYLNINNNFNFKKKRKLNYNSNGIVGIDNIIH